MDINPHIDDSWVPDGLKSLTNGIGGGALLALVVLLAFMAVLVVAAKLTHRGTTMAIDIVGVVLAMVLVANLGGAVRWGDATAPLPDGITVIPGATSTAKVDPATAAAYGLQAAQSFAQGAQSASQAGKDLHAAGSAASHGHLGQAAGHLADAAGHAAGAVGHDVHGALQAVQHNGLWNTIVAGGKAVGHKAGQLASQAGHAIVHWLGG